MKTDELLKRHQEVFACFLDKQPSIKLIDDWYKTDSIELQDFVGMNLKSSVQWATGIDIIEAVDTIVQGAIDNTNLSIEGKIQ